VKRPTVLLILILFLPIQVQERHSVANLSANGVATSQSAEPLQALAEYVEIIKSRGQNADDQGVLIESLDGRELLAEHNANVTFNPASVMKLATSLVALAKLGPDYRYRTNVFAGGPIDPGTRTLDGDLILEGSADPMFSLYDAQEVALQISRLGISHVTGALRIAGQFYYFANGYHSNLSPETSATKLRAAINHAGIRIDGDIVLGPKSGTLLLSHYSDPLASILLFQNAHSSNAVAEVVGVSVGGPQGIQDYLVRTVGLNESDIFVGRASGLDFNRITPRATLKVLRALIKVLESHSLRPEAVMAVAGIDSGTLRARFGRDDVRGSVVAKTGTLVSLDNGVSTLVGIAYTRANGPVLFAVFNSGGNVHSFRRLQDQFVERMIAEEGGAVPSGRNADALADATRQPIVQVFYRIGSQPTETSAE
jgi:D-alanyl-D-alanine carboxypeptidase